jgi:hypothetical protein
MKIAGVAAYAIGSAFALGALAGCAGSASGVQTYSPANVASAGTPNGTPFRDPSTFMPANAARSWMSPQAAQSKDLLYVSDYAGNANRVDIFSYPADKLVGTITTDMLNPDGLCVDKKGDVFVVNNTPNDNDVVEFAHGKTTPIAELVDPGESAISCAIDPVTGDLAVTSGTNISGGAGVVGIFPDGGKGTPTFYSDSSMQEMFWCGYDTKGDLFVDGQPGLYGVGFALAELPKGKKALTNIKLTGGKINYPGQVQWDGKYLLVGDQEAQGSGSPQTSAIYETTGATGKIVKKIALKGSTDVAQYEVLGSTILGPNSLDGSGGGGDVLFYKYPAGGASTKKLTGGFDYPIGLVVSP